jgi:hypothetical protein
LNEPLHVVAGAVGFCIFSIEMIFLPIFSSRLPVPPLGKHRNGWKHLNKPRARFEKITAKLLVYYFSVLLQPKAGFCGKSIFVWGCGLEFVVQIFKYIDIHST